MRIDIVLSPSQRAAIDKAAGWYKRGRERQQVFRLFGYAGTGKSTVQRVMLDELGVNPDDVLFLAPTGKAAAVLVDKGHHAQTIHRALYTQTGENDDVYEALSAERETIMAKLRLNSLENRGAYVRRLAAVETQMRSGEARSKPEFSFRGTTAISPRVKIIIIDECSMVKNDMFRDLLSLELPILLVGDPGQLPPVDRDDKTPSLALTGSTPDVMLREVVRQDGDSTLLRLASSIRDGRMFDFGASEDDHVSYLDGRGCRGDIGRISDKLDVDLSYFNQIICGRNKTRSALNDYMRKAHGITGDLPVGEKNEKLVSTKNIFIGEHFIANGASISVREDRRRRGEVTVWGHDFAIDHPVTVTSIDGRPTNIPGASLWKLPFESEEEYFSRSKSEEKAAKQLMQATWSWAITAHASQGSEWPTVCVFDESDCFKEHRLRWLYTAITRASKDLLIIKI
jgi:exodeoxyribonuclease-5